MCAVKTLNRTKVNQRILSEEYQIHQHLRNHIQPPSSLVQIMDLYQDQYLVHIVMEYMGGGDLRGRLQQQKSFSGRLLWNDYDSHIFSHFSLTMQ